MEEKSQLWFAIYSSFFLVQARRRKGKEEEKVKKSRYGNYHKPHLLMGY